MRIIKNTSRMLSIRDENLSFSGMIGMVSIVLAGMVLFLLASVQPPPALPAQVLMLFVIGIILGGGVLLGAWHAKVRVVTLNLAQESVTVAEGNWLRLHSVDVRPMSDIVQSKLTQEEEKISRDETHVPHIARTRYGPENYSDNDRRMGATTTGRSYGLKLVMRSGGDIPVSLRNRHWEEVQQMKDAISAFLSPFHDMRARRGRFFPEDRVMKNRLEEEPVKKKRAEEEEPVKKKRAR
jgi:hypothetical protein